ncbi:MAG: ABC transporter permease, partial [Hyphomicrobiales bacterium]|nr:ABC transporter permease [Hyphomicrobiales bacterium]
MRLELEKRAEQSRLMVVVSPLIAICLTLIAGSILFAALGHDPVRALVVYFVEPVTAAWSLQELIVKATPLVIIAVGLCVCYLSNTWNIGAEGQFTVGAILGSWVALTFNQWDSPLLLPLMLIVGTLGGMAWGAIPAILKTRFNTNEILTSLMLV